MAKLCIELDTYDGNITSESFEVNNIEEVNKHLSPYFKKYGSAGSEETGGCSLYIFDSGKAELTAYVEDDKGSHDITAYEDMFLYPDEEDDSYDEDWDDYDAAHPNDLHI